MDPQKSSELLERIRQIPPERRISIHGNISMEKLGGIKERLYRFQEETDGDILCTIDCVGGHFDAGVQLYHTLRTSPNEVIGKVDGKALSAGFIVLQGCSIRVATPESTLMIHSPVYHNLLTPIRHNMSRLEYLERQGIVYDTYHSQVVANRDTTLEILNQIVKFSDEKLIEKFLDDEKHLTPEQAIDMGFLDAVI